MLLLGDSRLEIPRLIDLNISVDSIVTDPPYELGFMNKAWDNTGITYDVEFWKLCLQILKPGGHLLSFGGSRTYHRMVCAIEDAGFEIKDQIIWLYGTGFPKSKNSLKPAHESIVLARKSLSEKTLLENIEKNGTGKINVEICRVGNDFLPAVTGGQSKIGTFERKSLMITPERIGRYPANLIHDGVADGIPEGWSRYFYCAKPTAKEKGAENSHPTVKPESLMRYICRLVTPAKGTILDPFLGSGTTGKAAANGGFNFIGIEKEELYYNIASKRLGGTN